MKFGQIEDSHIELSTAFAFIEDTVLDEAFVRPEVARRHEIALILRVRADFDGLLVSSAHFLKLASRDKSAVHVDIQVSNVVFDALR